MIQCVNCQTTATMESDVLPRGWLDVRDCDKISKRFCTFDCILHYLSKRLESTERARLATKESKW